MSDIGEMCPLLPKLPVDEVGHIEIFRHTQNGHMLLPGMFPQAYTYAHLAQDAGGGTYTVLAKSMLDGKQIKSQSAQGIIRIDGSAKRFENRSGQVREVPQAQVLPPSNPRGELPEMADLVPDSEMGSPFGGALGIGGGFEPKDVYAVDGKGTIAVKGLSPAEQLESINQQRGENMSMQMMMAMMNAQSQQTTALLTALVSKGGGGGSGSADVVAELQHQLNMVRNSSMMVTQENARLMSALSDVQNRYDNLRQRYDHEVESMRGRLMSAETNSMSSQRMVIEAERGKAMNDVELAKYKFDNSKDAPGILDQIMTVVPMLKGPVEQFLASRTGQGVANAAMNHVAHAASQPVSPAELEAMIPGG